ncbi:MAG: hypothetical protein ACREDK_04265 [Thermoplasmata archaeon]
MTVQTFRVVKSRGHQYRQRVEHFWDPRARRTRTRILENLGPLRPMFPRAPEPPALPLPPVHFALLAARMMTGTLTPLHVVQTVQEMGEEMPPGTLRAAGIRFDPGEKTLELLLWLDPPSLHPRSAPSAKLPSRSKGATPRRSSRSKGPSG